MERLNSWKEIADYLGVTVRTAQNWERERGLPVRRLPGGARSMVSALVSELDSWRDSHKADRVDEPRTNGRQDTPPSETPPEADPSPTTIPTNFPTSRSVPFTRSRFMAFAGIAVLLLLVGLLATARRRPAPASAKLENGALVAYDRDGRELWRHSFSAALDPALYAADAYTHEVNTFVWVGELEKGKTRVLFVFRPIADHAQSHILYCFSEDGRELWHFVPGRSVRTATENFEPFFFVRDFTVLPSGKQSMIVVSSGQYRFYPNQVALLSSDGKVVREYWHSGHLPHIAVADLNHDGKSEIYASGINNQDRIATLIVLDPDELGGASSQTDLRYQLLDMPVATERARLFFKPTCLSRVLWPYNVGGRISFRNDGLAVAVWESFREPSPLSVEYELGPELTVRSLLAPDAYATVHKQLELQGLLNHPFSPAELTVPEVRTAN